MFAGFTGVDLQRFILGCLTNQLATVGNRDCTSAFCAGTSSCSEVVRALPKCLSSGWHEPFADAWDYWDVGGVFGVLLLKCELVNVFYELVLINCAHFGEQTLLPRDCQVTNLTLGVLFLKKRDNLFWNEGALASITPDRRVVFASFECTRHGRGRLLRAECRQIVLSVNFSATDGDLKFSVRSSVTTLEEPTNG